MQIRHLFVFLVILGRQSDASNASHLQLVERKRFIQLQPVNIIRRGVGSGNIQVKMVDDSDDPFYKNNTKLFVFLRVWGWCGVEREKLTLI